MPSNQPSPDPRLSELNEELRRIIRWMLGEDGEFPPPPDYFFERRKPPSYWWRKELRKRFDAAVDAAVLLGGTPQPQELCDVCERPIGPADTIYCSHCGTKWAEPFPGRPACGGAASSRKDKCEEDTMNDIPRRCRTHLYVPAETAISAAKSAVEAMAADVRLTDAVILLGQAQDKVADFVDGVPSGAAASSPTPETWRDIETAPKDGLIVLLGEFTPFIRSHYIGHMACRGGGRQHWVTIPGAWERRPTHWMPLPAAPVRPETRPEPTDPAK